MRAFQLHHFVNGCDVSCKFYTMSRYFVYPAVNQHQLHSKFEPTVDLVTSHESNSGKILI